MGVWAVIFYYYLFPCGFYVSHGGYQNQEKHYQIFHWQHPLRFHNLGG